LPLLGHPNLLVDSEQVGEVEVSEVDARRFPLCRACLSVDGVLVDDLNQLALVIRSWEVLVNQ